MSDTTTIGLRIDNDLRDRIDAAAEQHGLSRTAYVLSWLPVYYEGPAKPGISEAQHRQRVAASQQRSSSARDSSSV